MHVRLSIPAVALAVAACSSNQAMPPSSGTVSPTPVYIGVPSGTVRTGVSADDGGMSTTLGVSPDRGWAALSAAYQILAIPVTTIDPSTHILGNHDLHIRGHLGRTRLSRFVDCGESVTGGPNADQYAVTLDVVSQLVPTKHDSTVVSTEVQASAVPSSGTSNPPVRCASTGRLERSIASLTLLHAAS
ncbi:MAG TPA: hypothetical protein VFW98_06450 [Gemmatimonadaceae bacterium]|nr:hypothetical protein [Gemmatimonadaceae bacterium]